MGRGALPVSRQRIREPSAGPLAGLDVRNMRLPIEDVREVVRLLVAAHNAEVAIGERYAPRMPTTPAGWSGNVFLNGNPCTLSGDTTPKRFAFGSVTANTYFYSDGPRPNPVPSDQWWRDLWNTFGDIEVDRFG